MSLFNVVNIVVTLSLSAIIIYFAHRVVRNSQEREQTVLEQGSDVNITILTMKQNGLFINNNPVIDMSLRVEDVKNQKSWLVEKHQETAWLIAVASYQVGEVYYGKVENKTGKIVFVKDGSGRPVQVGQPSVALKN
ncbi:hypothetical protein KXR87_22800 [Yokenella regensburgei]|uniref:hypothetical protein n=1 Tax=Yokenella regensburgei TaxID=158877 RepID=UPI003F151C54